MKENFKKYYRFLFAVIASLLFVGYYFQVFSNNHSGSIRSFQNRFSDLEEQLDDQLKLEKSKLKYKQAENRWVSPLQNDEVNIHIYRNDSLIYWNSNQLPIIRFADIHFPTSGILHLQNGWYFAKIAEVNHQLICASILVKRDYSYENKELINEFPENLHLPYSTYITFEQENGYPIYSKDRSYLFSIHPNEYQTADTRESTTLLLLLLLAISLWLATLFRFNSS